MHEAADAPSINTSRITLKSYVISSDGLLPGAGVLSSQMAARPVRDQDLSSFTSSADNRVQAPPVYVLGMYPESLFQLGLNRYRGSWQTDGRTDRRTDRITIACTRLTLRTVARKNQIPVSSVMM